MRKVYELDPTFATGEATVQPVLLWGANGRPLRERFTKTASEAGDFIRSVEPRPGTSIVLVLALGAYETYDLNRNGDGFNEHPYRDGFKPTCGCCTADAWVSRDEVLPAHYKSFDEHGKIYRHHQNKDPLKACGDVIKSFWNPQMHRVELLLGLKNDLAPDLAQRIADGEYPAVSMGCRIKYDVCTICGHRAATRAKYCDHLKYNMRQVMPNGLRAGALNPSPKFFDISFVVKPADQTGYMLKKVAEESPYSIRTSAEMGEYLERVEEKRAAIRKLADIDKVIRGMPVDHKTSPLSESEARAVNSYHAAIKPAISRMPELDPSTLTALSKHPVAEVLSTLSKAGIILTTPEFIQLVVSKLAPGTQIPEGMLDAAVALQGNVFDLFAQNPQMLEQLQGTGMFDMTEQNVNPQITGKLEQYIEKRSTITDYLSRALVPTSLRPEEPPFTDTLHLTDPSTGDRYQTNRGAAISAHDEIAKKQLLKLVGGSALLAGAYKLLAPGLPTVARPVAAATAGLIGYKHLQPDMGPQYTTDEGVSIPTLTELRKQSNELSHVALPILGSAALVAALGHDYDSRLRRGHDLHNPNAPVHAKLYNRVSEYASDHPALSFLTGLGGYGMAANLIGKFAAFMGDISINGTGDSVTLPSIDIDRAAQKLGSALLP